MNRQEISSRFSIRKIGIDEQIESFDCGDADLNDFILHESQLYRKALLAVSYVLERNDDKSVCAYFSLANDRISIEDFENNTAFNRFRRRRFVNEKRLKSYPAAKICRLAVSSQYRGEHIGSFILNFIKSSFVTDNKTGCRFLTVDAYRQTLPFYSVNHFIPLNEEDADAGTRLLFFDLETVA